LEASKVCGKIFEDDGVGNADGLQVLHRAAQNEAAEVLVANELDLAHLHGGAFLDIEVDLHRGRRNVLDIELDGGELVAVLGENLLENGGGAQDLGGSYWLSTVRPTFSFLKRSRTSDCETALRPL
jgi:hypothetical protein